MPIVTTSARKRPGRHSSLVTRHSSLAIAALAAIAIAVVLVALHFLREGPASSGPEPPKVSDTTAKPASRPAGTPATAAPAAATGGAASGRAEPERGEAPHLPAANRQTVQPSNSQTNSPLDEAEQERKKWEAERRLRHGTEQLLAMIISTDATGVPPLPVSEEAEESLRRDLLVAITNDISIFEDEDERTQEVKERVAEAKRQLADILQKGGSVVAAIREYEAYVNEGAKVRSEVLAKVAPEVEAISNDAEAVEYVESVNEALKKEDIPPIKLEEVGFEVEEPSGE